MAGNEIFRVVGRYMAGNELLAYQLVGSSGSNIKVNKEKAILMISRGLIENMRVQYSGDQVLIRGKGVNINNLPVYNMNTETFRNTPNYSNNTKQSRCNPIAQYKIIKRIMFKTSCVGYVVLDASGKELKINKNKADELGLSGLFINAEAHKYIPTGSTTPRITLRGVGCELRKLPQLLVDQNGNIVDTTIKNQNINVRATQLRKPGILYNDYAHAKKTFVPGDFLICRPDGTLDIMNNNDARGRLQKASINAAMCDNYLNRSSEFSFEFLGEPKRKMNPNIISRWPVITIMKN